MAAAGKTVTVNRANPSICIPRVFPNITWQRVKSIFEEMELGVIDRVDMVNKTNEKGEKFKRVFVHFKHWSRSASAKQVKEALLNGESVKIEYDQPWFWKVYLSNAPKPEFEKKTTPTAHKKRSAPRVVIGDESAEKPTAKSGVADELAAMKALIAAQKAEMEAMRAEMEATKYTPATPEYSPSMPDAEDVPELGAAPTEDEE
jgi:hypothetical protein